MAVSPRGRGQVLNHIAAQHPAAIAFDIVFSDPS